MNKTQYPLWILGTSFALLALDMLLLVSTLQLTGDHYSYSGVIVYPLFLHFVSPLFPALEIFLALLGAVGLIAANRVSSEIRVRQLSLGLLVIPIGIALWGLMSVALGRVPQPIQVSSVHFGDHVYDLIADPCYKMDSLCPPTSYIVLKCDSLGVVCQLWAVPWSETEYNKVSVDSTLIVDSSNLMLYAKIGERKIQVAGENSQ